MKFCDGIYIAYYSLSFTIVCDCDQKSKFLTMICALSDGE